MRIRFAVAGMALLATALAVGSAAMADEGMWTFDNFPSAKVKQLYGFAPDQKWLDRVRKASVRLDGGCSGSVVSKDGLVLTNHHCVVRLHERPVEPGQRLCQNGFFTPARKDEKICPGAEASILQSMSDVTQRVKDATAKAAAGQAASVRAAEIAAIEKEACGENRAEALRGGEPLSRRPVQALRVRPVRRRAHRLRAGNAGGVLRRRSGQFQLPALCARYGAAAALPRWQAGDVRRSAEA